RRARGSGATGLRGAWRGRIRAARPQRQPRGVHLARAVVGHSWAPWSLAPSGGRGVGVGGLAATPAQGSHARTIEQRTRRSSDPEPDREWGRGPLAAHRTDEAEVIRLGRGLSDDAKTWLRTALLRLVRRETPTDTWGPPWSGYAGGWSGDESGARGSRSGRTRG